MRKRIISALLTIFVLLSMLPTASFALTDSNYAYLFIAPDGSDDAAGTIDAPFATMGAAQRKIREMKKAGQIPSKGVVVYLRGGDYAIQEGTTFTSEDSGSEGAPIIYRSYPGEKAVLVGGASINVKEVKSVTDKAILDRVVDESARSQLVMVNLRQQGFNNLGEPFREGAYSHIEAYGYPAGPIARAPEFFCDGEIMTVARYPNNEYMTIKEVLFDGFNTDGLPDGSGKGDIYAGMEFSTDDKRFLNWTQASDALVFGYWQYDWADQSMFIKRIDTEKGSIKTDWGSCYGTKAGQRFFVYNLLEEIDAPGEYYIDRKNGILYFYPLKPMDQVKELKISILEDHVITFDEGAEYINIKDLKFTAIRRSAISIDNSSHIEVVGCEFEFTAETAVNIWKNATNCMVKSNYLHDVNGGIILRGGNFDTLEAGNSIAENNTIERFSRLTKTYNAAVAVYGVGNNCRYNEMRDGPHLAIVFDGQDNRVEYNDIHDVVKEGDDAAAVYGGLTLVGRGLQIRYNYIHDIKSDTAGNTGRAAVYLDGGQCGVTMAGNVVDNIDGYGFWLNGGQNNYVYNNIVLNTKESAVFVTDVMSDPGQEGNQQSFRAAAEVYSDNPIWREHYPEMFEQLENKDTTWLPINNMIQGNVAVNTRLTRYSGYAEEYINLKDNFSTNTDPGFYDMAKKNFLLKPDSQVYTEIPEFTPVPFTRMGTYSSRALQRVKDAVVLQVGSPFARNKNTDTMIDADNIMVTPFVEDGTTFVPVRFIAEALGATVDYNKDTREVTIMSGTDTLILTIDSLTAKKNGESVELIKAPQIKESRTLLPLRNVAELLGKEVFWDNCGLIVVSDDAELFSETSDEEIIDYLHEYLSIH